MVTANLNARVARNVSDLITRRRFTEAEICEQTGIKPATLRRKLAGRRAFQAEELVALAVVLDADPAAFLKGTRADALDSRGSKSA